MYIRIEHCIHNECRDKSVEIGIENWKCTRQLIKKYNGYHYAYPDINLDNLSVFLFTVNHVMVPIVLSAKRWSMGHDTKHNIYHFITLSGIFYMIVPRRDNYNQTDLSV